jgi:cyclic pyranopterin monophosphate synthase
MPRRKLTHVDSSNRPRMVDVGGKAATARTAVAEARVCFPQVVAEALRTGGMRSAKGPVIETAIIAGTLAAKRTHELIPFCHPLSIERCRIDAEFVSDTELAIRCEVAITHKTGVEMEALTGASVAALTVYDMCKALSHEIVIAEVRLLEKSGGKRRIRAGLIVDAEKKRRKTR